MKILGHGDLRPKAVSAAVVEDGKLRWPAPIRICGLTHSRTLLPHGGRHAAQPPACVLDDVDAAGRRQRARVSFTGLRIGVAAAEGPGLGPGTSPAAGVSTLDAMARNLAHMEGRHRLRHGRPAQSGLQRPVPGPGRCSSTRLCPDRAIGPGGAGGGAEKATRSPKIVVGDGARAVL